MKQKISILMAIFILQSCGPQSSLKTPEPTPQQVDQASEIKEPTGPLNLLAKCVQSETTQNSFQFNAKVYEDSQGERAQIIALRFNKYPNEFSQTDSNAIQFWAKGWSNMTWGQWKKRGFWVENAATKKRSPHQYTELTWAQWKQMAAYLELGSTSAESLLKSVNILIETEDVANRNQILTAKLYMPNESPEVTSLFPGYLASPRLMSDKKLPTVLLNLHPLANDVSKNLSEQEYLTKTNEFCFSL